MERPLNLPQFRNFRSMPGWRVLRAAVLTLLLSMTAAAAAQPMPKLGAITAAEVSSWFGADVQLAGEIKAPGYRLATVAGQVRGAVFPTHEIKPIPAYSRRPIAVLVAVAPDATILGARTPRPAEALPVVRVEGADLARFTDQLAGLR